MYPICSKSVLRLPIVGCHRASAQKCQWTETAYARGDNMCHTTWISFKKQNKTNKQKTWISFQSIYNLQRKNNEIDNDIHKLLPYPWRSDNEAYLIITQLRHVRPLRHTLLFGSWGMLDSTANLLIRWILRDGGKIETTKTQNDLLYNSSTQHLWSAPGKRPNTWRVFFFKIQRIKTANEWVKIWYGLLYQNANL